MRLALSLLFLALGTAALGGDGPERARKPSAPSRDAAPVRPSPEEREDAALAFVRTHHPELALLLEQLKSMKPAEYNRAINELYKVSSSLANLKTQNPRRYEVGLEVWKAKSAVQLLAAKWVSAPSEKLEADLRDALDHQVDVELRQQTLEQELVRDRLKRIDDQIKRLQKDRDKLIDSRLQVLKNKGQRPRRLDAGKSAPAKPAREKGDRKA